MICEQSDGEPRWWFFEQSNRCADCSLSTELPHLPQAISFAGFAAQLTEKWKSVRNGKGL